MCFIFVHLVYEGGGGPFLLGYIYIYIRLYHSICPLSLYDSIINVCQSCESSGGCARSPLLDLSWNTIISYYACVPCEERVWWASSPLPHLHFLSSYYISYMCTSWMQGVMVSFFLATSCRMRASRPSFFLQICPQSISIYTYVCMCVCVCVCDSTIHMRGMTSCSTCVHDSFSHICATPLMCLASFHTSHMTHSSLCATRLIHPYVWHDALVHMCDMTHSSRQCVPWRIHVCVSHSRYAYTPP